MNVPNVKIEQRGLNALRDIIDDSLVMDHKFSSCDRDIAWDGFIEIFKEGSLDKKDLDDKIPVQIKGHIDIERKYINKQRITYPVDLDDLKIYFSDRGVLYFQIFLSEDGKRKEVFCSSLYPSRLKKYIELAELKGNKNTLNIPFSKLSKNPDDLYFKAKQFSKESRYQGFGNGPIVNRTILASEIHQVSTISATAIGALNEQEFLKKLGSGDVCMYGLKEGSDIKLPIEYVEDSEFSITKEVENNVRIGDKVYYQKYEVISTSKGDTKLRFSENLEMSTKGHVINFKPRSNIEGISKDAKLLLSLNDNKDLTIGDCPIGILDFQIPKRMLEELDFFIKLNEVLKMIEFNYSKSFAEIASDTIKAFLKLVDIKQGKRNSQMDQKIHIYNWTIEGKYMPVIIERHEEDEENNLINALYSKDFSLGVSTSDDIFYNVPLFGHLKKEVLSNLYYEDYKYFYEQIDNTDINEDTAGYLNNASLTLISSFDITQNDKFLDSAVYLLQKLNAALGDQTYVRINLIQISKRKGVLQDEDIQYLKSLDSTSNDRQTKCIVAILLDRYEVATEIYKQMKPEEVLKLQNSPIFHLFREG